MLSIVLVDINKIIIIGRCFFLFRTIFEWRTPTAYIFAFTFQFITAAYAIISAIVLLIHSFGSCWIFIAFVDDIQIDMCALDTHKRNGASNAKFYEYLINFIQLRKKIKQLSHCILFESITMNLYNCSHFLRFFRLLAKFINMYALPFMLNLVWTASTMVVVLVSLQMELVKCHTLIHYFNYFMRN